MHYPCAGAPPPSPSSGVGNETYNASPSPTVEIPLPSPVPVLPSPVPVLPSPVPVLPSPVPVLPSPVPVTPSPTVSSNRQDECVEPVNVLPVTGVPTGECVVYGKDGAVLDSSNVSCEQCQVRSSAAAVPATPSMLASAVIRGWASTNASTRLRLHCRGCVTRTG
jgi:hypothetical protein